MDKFELNKVFARIHWRIDPIMDKLPYCLGWGIYNKYKDIIRFIKSSYQKLTKGYADEETWSLDRTISKFIIPRLKRYKELNNGFPGGLNEKEWNKILDEMIWAFEYNEMYYNDLSDEEYKKLLKRHQEGLKLFAKHFDELWW